MKVSEFVEKYNQIQLNEKLIEKLLTEITKENIYIPYLQKITLATTIGNTCMIDSESSLLRLNTPKKYALSLMTIIYETTLLEQSDENNGLNIYNDYDLLKQYDLINIILEKLNIKKEYEEFNSILDMVCADTMQNKYDTHSFILEIANIITDTLINLIEPFGSVIEKIIETSITDDELPAE